LKAAGQTSGETDPALDRWCLNIYRYLCAVLMVPQEGMVMDIGSKLQKARLDKGITLREISASTKISHHVLEALERNDLARLPGGIFTRGYLRAYAKELGLDPEQVVAEFRSQTEEPAEDIVTTQAIDPVDWHARYRSIGVATMLGMAAALIIYTSFTVRSADELSDQEIVGTVATGGELVVPPAPTSNAATTNTDAEPALRVELQPRGECWISATVDGRLVVYRLMAPGERATLDAREEIRLRVGDAGAFSYVINGTQGRSLGGHGQAVTIHITKRNYNALLAKASTPLTGDPLTDAPTHQSLPRETPSNTQPGTGV
jgi:cytoskeletal protein RodZ